MHTWQCKLAACGRRLGCLSSEQQVFKQKLTPLPAPGGGRAVGGRGPRVGAAAGGARLAAPARAPPDPGRRIPGCAITVAICMIYRLWRTTMGTCSTQWRCGHVLAGRLWSTHCSGGPPLRRCSLASDLPALRMCYNNCGRLLFSSSKMRGSIQGFLHVIPCPPASYPVNF